MRRGTVFLVHKIESYEIGAKRVQPARLGEAAVTAVLILINVILENSFILFGKLGMLIQVIENCFRHTVADVTGKRENEIARLGLKDASCKIVYHAGVTAVTVYDEYFLKAVAIDFLARLLKYLVNESFGENYSSGIFARARLLSEVHSREYHHRLALCRES